MHGRNHVSWALDVNGRLYWFDAGESCSHTAYLLGLDLMAIRSIFISHPHIDHVGGALRIVRAIRVDRLEMLTVPPSGTPEKQ